MLTLNSRSTCSGPENHMVNLQVEVMACSYDDVQVMWSILDKSNTRT